MPRKRQSTPKDKLAGKSKGNLGQTEADLEKTGKEQSSQGIASSQVQSAAGDDLPALEAVVRDKARAEARAFGKYGPLRCSKATCPE